MGKKHDTEHSATDRSSLHRYRTEIPNIIDDMGLSVYAFRLYVRLKRVAGDDGKCFYSTRDLAEQCKMSVGAVSNAKKELLGKELIRIENDGEWERDNITIVDLWPANFAYFAQEKEPPVCSPHEQELPSSVHVVNRPVHTVNAPVHHMNNKEDPYKEKPIKEEPVGESAPSPPVKIHARNGSHREMVYKSPHVNKNHFDRATGFVRPGSGTTAVEIYYERFDICSDEHRLNAILEDDLVRHCRDLGLLREVITAYHQAGHRPRNIKLILDWYRDPSRFRKEPHGTNFGRTSGNHAPPPVANFTQREWDEWLAQPTNRDKDIPY